MSLITVNRIKDVVVAAVLNGKPLSLWIIAQSLTALDLGLAFLGLGVFCYVLIQEFRYGALTQFLHTATGGQCLLLLTILSGWFGHSYLYPGVLLGGDTGTHISRFLEVSRGLSVSEIPLWTNYQYAGAPLLWFTGPLTYVVGGVVAFLLQDAVVAAKVVLFVLHLCSAWLYYLLLRRFGIRPVAAAVVSAGFAGAFAHLHLFLHRGVFPQAFTFLFLILLFWSADGLLRGIGSRALNFLAFALSTAGLILNHQPHALFAAIYLAVFGVAALLAGFWEWRRLTPIAFAGLLGLVTSTVAILPVIAESDWVMIEPEGGALGWHLPTASRLLNLVLWRNSRTTWGIDYWAYLGIGLIIFGLAGVAMTLSRRAGTPTGGIGWPALCCLTFCFFLYNPVVRDVIYLLFFLGLLAAIGLDRLLDGTLLAGRRLSLLFAVVMLDLASTSVQPVARTDKEFLVQAGKLLERTAPNERVIELTRQPDGAIEADIGPDASPISYYSVVQRIAGNHNMAATRVHNFLAVTAKMAEHDLSLGELSANTRAALALFNVTRLICHSSVANGCPDWGPATAENPVLGRFVPILASPVLFSNRLTVSELPPGLDKPMLWPDDFHSPKPKPAISETEAELLKVSVLEQADFTTRSARAIAVRNEAAAKFEPANGDQSPPQLRRYVVHLDKVELDVFSPGPAYAQLAHPWFPSISLEINGSAVQPLRGTLDLIVVPLQQGMNQITLRDDWTPVRFGAAMISLVGFLVTLCASLVLGLRDLRRQRNRVSGLRHGARPGGSLASF